MIFLEIIELGHQLQDNREYVLYSQNNRRTIITDSKPETQKSKIYSGNSLLREQAKQQYNKELEELAKSLAKV